MYARHAPLWASTYHAFQMSPYGKYREHYKPVAFGFSKKYLRSIVGKQDTDLNTLIKEYIDMTEGDEEDDFWNVISEKLIKILNEMDKSYEDGLALVEQLLMGPILDETIRQIGGNDALTNKYNLTEDSTAMFSTKNFINAFFNVFKRLWWAGCTSAERSLPVTVSAKESRHSWVPVDRREDGTSIRKRPLQWDEWLSDREKELLNEDRPPGWDEWLREHDTELLKEYPYTYDMTLQLKGKLKRTKKKASLTKIMFYELLTPGKDINAEIIDYYLLMLQDRENLRCDMRMQGINVYFYDTKFYIAYENAQSSEHWYYHIWKTRDLDYAYVHYLFIPVSQPNHYTCFMIDIRQKKVYYYDSLDYGVAIEEPIEVPIEFLRTFGKYVIKTGGSECTTALGWLANVEKDEHLIVYNDVQQEGDYSDQYYDRANDLQQEDGKPTRYYDRANDCAMFVCQFMKELSKDPENLAYYLENDLKNDDDEYSHHFPHCFEPGRGNYYRRRMAEEIRTNSLDHPIAYETSSSYPEKTEAINTLLPYIPYYHYLHGQAFALSVEELNEIIRYMESNFPCVNCKRKHPPQPCKLCDKLKQAAKKRRGGDVKYAEVDTLN